MTEEEKIDVIGEYTADFNGISYELLKTKTRVREIVQARQEAMYYAKILTKNSLALIGSKLGNKDHATVIHACKTITNICDTDSKFETDVKINLKKIKPLIGQNQELSRVQYLNISEKLQRLDFLIRHYEVYTSEERIRKLIRKHNQLIMNLYKNK